MQPLYIESILKQDPRKNVSRFEIELQAKITLFQLKILQYIAVCYWFQYVFTTKNSTLSNIEYEPIRCLGPSWKLSKLISFLQILTSGTKLCGLKLNEGTKFF